MPPGGTCPVVADSEVPAKWLGYMKSNFIRLADFWAGVECNLAEECYNYVVRESLSTGVNPAFSLAIWLRESGASNYCYAPGVQDFGINVAGLGENIVAQLDRFLKLPFLGSYLECRTVSGFIEPMHGFLEKFRTGTCLNGPTAIGTQSYKNVRDEPWLWVTEPYGPCLSGGLFSISWPTDNSCP